MARSAAARCAAAVTVAAAAAALLLVAALPSASAAAAAKRGFNDADEQALYADVLKGLGVWSDAVVKGKKLPDEPAAPTATIGARVATFAAAGAAALTTKSAAGAASASTTSMAAAVPSTAASSAVVARAIGRVLAATAIEAEVQSTLGAPDKFK